MRQPERRLYYKSATMRILDVVVVTTSLWSGAPLLVRRPSEDITYIDPAEIQISVF